MAEYFEGRFTPILSPPSHTPSPTTSSPASSALQERARAVRVSRAAAASPTEPPPSFSLPGLFAARHGGGDSSADGATPELTRTFSAPLAVAADPLVECAETPAAAAAAAVSQPAAQAPPSSNGLGAGVANPSATAAAPAAAVDGQPSTQTQPSAPAVPPQEPCSWSSHDSSPPLVMLPPVTPGEFKRPKHAGYALAACQQQQQQQALLQRRQQRLEVEEQQQQQQQQHALQRQLQHLEVEEQGQHEQQPPAAGKAQQQPSYMSQRPPTLSLEAAPADGPTPHNLLGSPLTPSPASGGDAGGKEEGMVKLLTPVTPGAFMVPKHQHHQQQQ
eukprot:scaffold27540_cov15-Tisochrysis_lutea.AAC.1